VSGAFETHRLGHPRVHRRCTESTNELARELAARGAPHGTLVTADAQRAGRGRHGRTWWAPARSSLLMSLVLREAPPLLPLAAPLAVCDAVSETVGVEALVKWPNDVVLAEPSPSLSGVLQLRKLAGILVEGRPQEGCVILGIGVNVSISIDAIPPELQGTLATLAQPRSAIERLLASALRALERRLAESDELTLEGWRERDALRGHEVTWSTTAAGAERAGGRAEGIDGEGRLIVALDDGSRLALEAGEVHLAR